MILNATEPLATLAAGQPALVHRALRAALRIEELEQLYIHARRQGGEPFSRVVLNALDIKVQLDPSDLERIASCGPLVLLANHPFGLLDGLILHSITGTARADIKMLANTIVCSVPELADSFIPVDVFAPRACRQNVRAVRHTLQWLSQGHCIATFPAGTVSHWNPDEKRIVDPEWHAFAVRCALRAGAPLVPVYFDGRNSLAFQFAGMLHPHLRTARLPTELLNKRGTTVHIRIGAPIAPNELAALGNEQLATEYVKARVYLLRNRPIPGHGANRTVLALRARMRAPKAICPPIAGISDEIKTLDENGKRLIENEAYAVYEELGHQIPLLLHEIGRLRESTFRKVREGTGRHIDIDEFDASYTHLILWHKPTASVAGAYRLARTTDASRLQAGKGLYTSKLFRYTPEFFSCIGPAIELGRSFIATEHQRAYAPLLLLWQAIARYVAQRPNFPVLFGAVSISTAYPQAARELIVRFLRERAFREDLSPFLSPRCPFHSHLIHRQELTSIIRCLHDLAELPVKDLGLQEEVPVLLRQYLRLGGKVAAFNVDSRFSNVLDALLIVDLRSAPRKMLTKYMGAELSEKFFQHAFAPLAPASKPA